MWKFNNLQIWFRRTGRGIFKVIESNNDDIIPLTKLPNEDFSTNTRALAPAHAMRKFDYFQTT
jgi:hypothetical protein